MHLTKLYNVADEQTRRQIMDQIDQFYWDDNGGETDGPDYLIECNELAQPIEGLQTIDGTYLDGYSQDEHEDALNSLNVPWTGWQAEGYALIAASPEEVEKALSKSEE